MKARKKGVWHKPTNRTLAMVARRKKLSTEAHLQMSIEDWRAKKRQQWLTVMHALDLFGYGAAYTPVGSDLYELEKAAFRIKESMEADWVCW